MNELIAICGLNCSECEAFVATKNNDNILRQKIADEWSKMYNFNINLEDINCVGCKKDGDHIGYCNMCEVRKCGNSKKIDNCGVCSKYPDCEIINNFIKSAPEEGAKKIKLNLEKIRSGK